MVVLDEETRSHKYLSTTLCSFESFTSCQIHQRHASHNLSNKWVGGWVGGWVRGCAKGDVHVC